MEKKRNCQIYALSLDTGKLKIANNFYTNDKLSWFHEFFFQTCMGKDIVLHVSATNPAAFLYLKFGFKIEEIIQNFYENYQQTEDSKHALYLKLSR